MCDFEMGGDSVVSRGMAWVEVDARALDPLCRAWQRDATYIAEGAGKHRSITRGVMGLPPPPSTGVAHRSPAVLHFGPALQASPLGYRRAGFQTLCQL